MALTDLTGTTWIFPNPPDMSGYPFDYRDIYLNFEANGEQFARILAWADAIYYYYPNGRFVSVWTNAGAAPRWENYRTLKITGGTDATNATFIAWLETHAGLYIKAYRATETALTETADAIRARGGTSAEIEWKANGFADAITNMVVPIPSDYGHISWDGHALTVS